MQSFAMFVAGAVATVLRMPVRVLALPLVVHYIGVFLDVTASCAGVASDGWVVGFGRVW